jgi:hypothetical protein
MKPFKAPKLIRIKTVSGEELIAPEGQPREVIGFKQPVLLCYSTTTGKTYALADLLAEYVIPSTLPDAGHPRRGNGSLLIFSLAMQSYNVEADQMAVLENISASSKEFWSTACKD